MPSKPINEEDVLIKGSSTGILIMLNLNQDYEKLIKKLVQKVKKDKKFLSETKLFIKGNDRLLDKDELGMARKMVKDKTGLELFQPEAESNEESSTKTEIEETNETEYIAHTLRAGEVISSNRNVVIFGDVNGGASVSSLGSIVVFGKIRGSVEAGAKGAKKAIIAAYGFSPIFCKIAGFDGPSVIENQDLISTPCFLSLEEDQIKLHTMKKD